MTTTALVERGGLALPVSEEKFDLTLLDYRLQNCKAVDVVKRIRGLWPDMRIVVLSDMMWLPDDIAPMANGFIRKGEPQLLVDKIAEMTRGSDLASGPA